MSRVLCGTLARRRGLAWALAVAAPAVAVAASLSNSRVRAQPRGHTAAAAPTSSAPGLARSLVDLSESFSAFVEPLMTTPAGVVARLPAAVDGALAPSATGREDSADAAYLWEPAPGYEAWATPSTGGVCLAVVRATGGQVARVCGTVAAAVRGHLIVTAYSANLGPVLVGLVPDSDRTVAIRSLHNRSLTVVVHNNLWAARVRGACAWIEVRGAARRHLAIVCRTSASAKAMRRRRMGFADETSTVGAFACGVAAVHCESLRGVVRSRRLPAATGFAATIDRQDEWASSTR